MVTRARPSPWRALCLVIVLLPGFLMPTGC